MAAGRPRRRQRLRRRPRGVLQLTARLRDGGGEHFLVFYRGLLQLTMDVPQLVYYGGLVMGQVRHFDPDCRRPRILPGVSALVKDADSKGVEPTLVNINARSREVIVQTEANDEHEIEMSVSTALTGRLTK